MSKIDIIKEVYEGNLPIDKQYEILRSCQKEDLVSKEDHLLYIKAVASFRNSLMNSIKLIGQNFLNLLESLLSVGEEGVYTNNQRFIYELIQNVDDCEYDDISNCNLDIQFCFDEEPGKIILVYNEKGFTPENVFAITGIAEASKNLSSDKIEIGEKGIGFKSVFGIADKVLIQSGYFSFALYKDNFTVPVPEYDNYKPVNGTKLTLEMSREDCKNTYDKLLAQYSDYDSILNNNPIIFLNKLSHLRLFCDNSGYIEFDVQRTNPIKRNGLEAELNIKIAVEVQENIDDSYKITRKEIICHRYSLPVIYGKEECISRYGKDISFLEKRHNLTVVFPVEMEGILKFQGRLYSFLPTQVKTNAPVILHVPYKLNGSREYVHSQGNNAWFKFTNEKLRILLHRSYEDLAKCLNQKIVYYIPKKHVDFFKNDNEKVKCLLLPGIHSNILCQLNIFYAEDGTYNSIEKIVAFGCYEKIDDPNYIYGLLGRKEKLFIPPSSIDMKWFGCKTIDNISEVLFTCGIKNEELFEEILAWLEKNDSDLRYDKLIEKNEPIFLGSLHIKVIAKNDRIKRAFMRSVSKHLRSKNNSSMPPYFLKEKSQKYGSKSRDEIRNLVHNADLEECFVSYLNKIDFMFFKCESEKKIALATSDGIVLSVGHEYSSFSDLSSYFDERGTFSASLKIMQASRKLNKIDESISNTDYLKILREVRRSLRNILGEENYSTYVRILIEAGANNNRFFSEILQNADDCSYAENVIPEMILKFEDDNLVVTYNEEGFTKNNVRAITAIGESTKKMLLASDHNTIGEKGVGFKTVFGVASSVEIHSNGFDFVLTDQTPTIPDKCASIPLERGTYMSFRMKKKIEDFFSTKRLLELCLCLRRLKRITIGNHSVTIEDNEYFRRIVVDGVESTYGRFVYDFHVDNELLLVQKNGFNKYGQDQKIIFYLPSSKTVTELSLYTGLPLLVKCNIPLIIDAPFELTTSRENVLENEWNRVVRQNIYKGIIKLMLSQSKQKLDVLRFVHLSSKGNISSIQLFENDFLCKEQWLDELKKAKIIPVLGKEDRVSVSSGRCLLIPEFIGKLYQKINLQILFQGYIVDSIGKTQYTSILEHIGCVKVNGITISRFLQKYASSLIVNEIFRKGLYDYLSGNQGNVFFEGIGNTVLSIPIFPIRTTLGTRYICYTESLYHHKTEMSNDEYKILDTNTMSIGMADSILKSTHSRVKELTQEVLDAKYQKRVEDLIENKKKYRSNKEIFTILLDEYRNNNNAFIKCKNILRGLKSKVPLLMSDKTIRTGNKYLNQSDQFYGGKIIPSLIVDNSCKKIGELLELSDIRGIHYSDIKQELSFVSNDDIEDFECDFQNYFDLMCGMYEDGLLTDEQISTYHLDFVKTKSQSNSKDPYEEFPEKQIKNYNSLKEHIRNAWKLAPNPYVEKKYIKREPLKPIDKTSYTSNMYGSIYSKDKCFCQMCRKLYPNRYIERNDIEKVPSFAWNQMYLSLCLQCSKDFVLIRNNNTIWERFIKDIKNANVLNVGIVEINIGDRTISFTATHLAEVQEIIKNENIL